MTQAKIQPSFAAGEMSPSLFGRVDLAKFHIGAATMRNMFVNYRGGASSRAGTAYVGKSKQPGSGLPPRLIPFQFNVNQGYALEFGNQYMRVITDGGYVTETAINITGITQANPAVFTVPSHGYSAGDLIFLSGIGGVTELNGLLFLVATVPSANTFTLTDLFGTLVNTLNFPAYISGGTAARVFTLITPYLDVDLPLLKFAESADVMSITHPNYPQSDLTRLGAANWTLTQTSFGSGTLPPAACVLSASVSATNTATSTQYSFVVTAIDAKTGLESVASPIGTVTNSIDISVTAGSLTVTWTPVIGASQYNIYKAPAAFAGASTPIGALYGFAGTAFGTQFVDTNITQDFSQSPPLHENPFAPSSITSLTAVSVGSAYIPGTTVVTINTSTGSGAVITPVVAFGQVQAYIVTNGGIRYSPTDTVTITDAGGGTGATATLNVGPATGTYPGSVAYFQQRRVYANSTNNPDTYWMSQPGGFTCFDASIPVIASDAITGTPWAQQVNGISALVPMPGGLVILTGKGAWQLSGTAGPGSPVTPSDQNAQPQAYNGCSPILPPINVNFDILYVQEKGSVVRDLSFNFFTNIYTGTDITVLSNHLFTGFTLREWTWAEEPYKMVWAVRADGVLLGLTYLKEQDIYGWSRHDTNGLYVSVCSVSEGLVNAVYVVVQRFIRGQFVYYIERFDNRIWSTIEQTWCVDAGLSYPQSFPNATLTASAASGPLGILSVNVVSGGAGYTSPTFQITDRSGSGSGATFSSTVVSGVITGITPLTEGTNYLAPQLTISDPTGMGAVATMVIDSTVTMTASDPVFTAGMVGNVIRVGNGKGTITQFLSSTQVVVNLTQSITSVLQNNPQNMPIPAQSGSWSISVPTSSVTGLNHLEGMTVTGIADGSVITPQVVANGTIVLPQPASAITVGLPYQCQLQSLYSDIPGEATVQGKRKNIYAVTARLESSRGIKIGSNQVDASTTPGQATIPWKNLKEIKERGNSVFAGVNIPLFTGDERINIVGNWKKPGQISIQQDYPLPLNVTALIPEEVVGDTNG